MSSLRSLSLDPLVAKAICSAVDEAFEEQITFTQKLIRYETQRGNCAEAQQFMHHAMSDVGLSVTDLSIDTAEIQSHPGSSPVVGDNSDAINIVGTHQPKNNGNKRRTLIINGHMDVVPTGPADMWSFPPYEPTVHGDWLHGRGSGDMKAGLAANLFAFSALKRAGYQPASTVHLQSVTEEECTGNGTLCCLIKGYSADAVLITEPTDELLVRANVGVVWFAVEIRGRPAHVLEATKGNNAIVSSYKIIQALQELENRLNDRKADHGTDFCNHPKPITINVGKIVGGDWPSSVPCWTRLEVRAGIYPGMEVKQAKEEIEKAIFQGVKDDPYLKEHPPIITYHGFTSEGYKLPRGNAAEACLKRVHAAVACNDDQRELKDFVMPCYLDARIYALYNNDTPALVYGPTSERIHGFDERVELGSVKRVTKVVALFIAEWCGLETVSTHSHLS